MEYNFTLQQPCHNVVIVKKHYGGLDLMVVYSWNFAFVKRQPWKKKKSLKLTIFLKLWSSYQMF